MICWGACFYVPLELHTTRSLIVVTVHAQFWLFLFHVLICPLSIWSEAIVFCRFYVFRAVFSTIVVSLSCPLYVIDTLCFCAFWTKKDRQINEVHAIETHAPCVRVVLKHLRAFCIGHFDAPPLRQFDASATALQLIAVYVSFIGLWSNERMSLPPSQRPARRVIDTRPNATP